MLRFALTALALLVALGAPTVAQADNGHDVPSRTFEFTYAVEIPAPVSGTRTLEVWIPLPMDDPGVQTIHRLSIDAPGNFQVTEDPVYGNRMIHLKMAAPEGTTEISWTAVLTRYEDRGQGHREANENYLRANRLIPIDGVADDLAQRMGAKDVSTPLHDRAKTIYDDVLSGMVYDKSVPGYGLGSFERSVTICKGNCTDFHARFIGIGRAAGIPVRFTMGIPMKTAAEGTYNSYHCWAHYHDGMHWHPVDISEADKVVESDPERAQWFFRHLTIDRIALTHGRDLILEPAQSGDRLNYFVFPYAEADGQAMDLDKTMWQFDYRNVER